MTKKIFWSMVFVELVVLVLSISMYGATLNQKFEERSVEEMRIQSGLIEEGILYGGLEYLQSTNYMYRVSWLDEQGTIVFDSSGVTGSRGDREEVAEAKASGEGIAVRYSRTKEGMYIYYAKRLQDGTVLRMSCAENSVRSIFFSMTRNFLWVIIFLICGSFVLAYYVTMRIIKPLEKLNMDNLDEVEIYRELQPLTNQLLEQRHVIGKQMMELRTREREFAVITENMREGFVLFDGYATVVSYNHSGGILMDAVEAARGRLVISEDFAQVRSAVYRAVLGQHWEGYQEYNHRMYQCIVNPVINLGQVLGVVLFMMDVTEKYQREQLRRDFSANVSHELKTPLTSISGFAELMMNGMIPRDRMQECAGDIYKQSQRLITLIGDIIQLTNLEEGRSFTSEQVDLYHAALQVQQRLAATAEQKRIIFQIEGAPCTIQAVPQIVDEILYNLCDNAIKYNVPGGRVTVGIRPGISTTMVTVSDTGIGIPLEEQERVFERFYRVNKSHSNEIDGTGLGLSIVKHGVQFLEAELTMSSTVGKGTTVNIMFKNNTVL